MDKLFDVCAQFVESRVLSSVTGYSGAQNTSTSVNAGHTTVTTNYDMSIELYHRLLGSPLIDGFKPTNDPFVRELDSKCYSGFSDNYQQKWLIKLHGSIWQFRQGNRVIKTIEDPKKSSLDIKIDEQMMIYPIGEKPILKNPYYMFYEIFKEQMWKRMLVIGYSFRDEPVNVAILENLEKVKGSTLIIIDPVAEKAIQNLGFHAQIFDNRIIRIPKKFEEEGVFEKLELAMKVDSWKRYKEREWEWLKESSTRAWRP